MIHLDPTRNPEAESKILFSNPRIRPASLILGVLLVVGIGILAFLTESGVDDSRRWVVHSYDVRSELEALQMEISEARASRSAFLLTSEQSQFFHFQQQIGQIPQMLKGLRVAIADNPRQLGRLDRLEPLLEQQITQMAGSMETGLPRASGSTELTESTRQILESQLQIDSVIRNMADEEQILLESRLKNWTQYFRRNLITLSLAFGAAILLLVFNFRMLLSEVRKTRELERLERDNAESYRALSARILELQDNERRRVARDLHDSVGQFLAGLKINLSQLKSARPGSGGTNPQLLSETIDLADRAIGEVRTISHLLHPPLLDELGFDSAARWYIEEFAKRGGVHVNLKVADIAERLPRGIELALFRILQETLTNVHRHSGAHCVDIEMTCHDELVVLTIHDDGRGIPLEVLLRFRAGMAAGVGLAGMKERVAELGGKLEVESNRQGTMIRATLPTTACDSNEDESQSFSAAAR